MQSSSCCSTSIINIVVYGYVWMKKRISLQNLYKVQY